MDVYLRYESGRGIGEGKEGGKEEVFHYVVCVIYSSLIVIFNC